MKKSRDKIIENLRCHRREFLRLKRVLKNGNWEGFCKTYKRHYPLDEPLTQRDEEYLKTHLTELDDVKKAWYLHAMKTWTKEDYENHAKVTLWMLGEPTKDLKKAKTIDEVEKILRKKKKCNPK